MPSILLVEDHPMMRQTLAHFLKKHGNFAIWDVASSAEAALDQLSQTDADDPMLKSPPDLLLIDVSLPGMSGIDLLAIVQAKYPDLLCLMLSGHERFHYMQKSRDNGAQGYVTKGNPLFMLHGIQRVLAGGTYWDGES